MWLSIDTFQILMSCVVFIVSASLLNVESYVFVNIFHLVLFSIHGCVHDVMEKRFFSQVNDFRKKYQQK